MKKIFNIILFFALATLSVVAASQKHEGEIDIVSADLRQEGDLLYVTMNLDMSKLDLSSRNEVILTPVLVSKDNANREVLPNLLIFGKNRYKAYSRSVALKKDQVDLRDSAYGVVKSKKDMKGIVTYSQTVQHQEWMKNSELVIEGDLCGCGKIEPLAQINVTERSMYEFNPQLAYIQPEVEPVKIRTEDTEVFIDFKVNQSVIQRDLMNNQAELAKLDKAFEEVRSDKSLTVNRIDVIGYASPEGSVAYNETLSKKRAEELRKYLSEKAYFPSEVYHVQYGGENWDGLVKMVEASTMDSKSEVLSIINNTSDVNPRKNKLKALDKGRPYDYMLKNFYPKLRKTITQIHYNVRNFSVEEGKEILKTRPGQLSLNEMFLIGNSYTKGSNEFSEVFNTAATVYPNSKIANLNAGAAALSAGDLNAAKRYLDKADKNSAEYENNMGVYYYQSDDLLKAKEYFSGAAQKGSEVGRMNLNELNKKTEIERIEL